MKCLIIGGGIHGVLTAYFLQKLGYIVDLLEFQPQVGMRATFANGCQLSFSHTTPMNITPSFYGASFFRPVMFEKHTKKWLKEHQNTAKNFDDKFKTLMSSADFSKSAFEGIFLENSNIPDGIGHKSGTMFVFSNKKQMDWRKKHFQTQNESYGINYKAFTSFEDICNIDDGVASMQNVCGGIFTDCDSTLEAYRFTNYIADTIQSRNVRIFFNTQVTQIIQKNNRVVEVQTNQGVFSGYDEYIYCGGASGLNLLNTFNLNLHPVQGYSLTFDVSYSNHCPRVNIVDFTNKVVYSRHQDFLRVAGFFDVSNPKNHTKRIQTLYKKAIERFPILQRQKLIHQWHEQRVFSTNEVPVVRKVLDNLTVNTAHGHLGITLSAGSAKKVSQIASSCSYHQP